MPKGYALKQVAKEVGKHPATIVRWIDTGKVKITKKYTAQGQYVFTEADLRTLKEYSEKIIVK